MAGFKALKWTGKKFQWYKGYGNNLFFGAFKTINTCEDF